MDTPLDGRYWPPGLPFSLDYPDVPVAAILAGSAARWPGRVAFRQAGREMRYGELWREACRFGNGLRALGVGRGDVVACRLPNVLEFPVVYYGVLLAGAVFCPVNPLLPGGDLAVQLGECGAVALVTADLGPAVLEAVEEVGPRHVVVAGDGAGAAVPGGRAVGLAAVGAGRGCDPPSAGLVPRADLAHIVYTGGTTGHPKGAMLTHRNVVANTLQNACWFTGTVPRAGAGAGGHPGVVLEAAGPAAEYAQRPGETSIVTVAPWFHALGLIAYLGLQVAVGSTVVVHSRFDVAAFVADARRFGVTQVGGAPAMLRALLADPSCRAGGLPSVRTVTSGAAPLPGETFAGLRERFPGAAIVEGYGLAEVTMGVSANPVNGSGPRKAGSVGLPIFDTEVKIVDAGGAVVTGDTPGVGAGREGEICVRGPQVMAGYRNRPEETAAVLSADGWLRTGDVGVVDEDGYLSVVGRMKDLLIYKGYNVYPRELEEILLAHPAVRNVAVVGRPDAEAGEVPVAFVATAAPVGAEDLLAYVNGRVVPYKRVREVRFVDEIPVSASGKILKRLLRDFL